MKYALRHLITSIVSLLLAITTCVSAQKPGSYDGREKLKQYPEVTLLIEVKDARKAEKLIRKSGGKIVYDPNLGIGHDIPFLVVTLPGDKIVDAAFIKSLELKSGTAPFH